MSFHIRDQFVTVLSALLRMKATPILDACALDTGNIKSHAPLTLIRANETKTHKPPLVTRTEQQQQLVVSDPLEMATGGGNTVWTWKKRKTLVTNVSASNTTSGDGTQTSDCVSVVI